VGGTQNLLSRKRTQRRGRAIETGGERAMTFDPGGLGTAELNSTHVTERAKKVSYQNGNETCSPSTSWLTTVESEGVRDKTKTESPPKKPPKHPRNLPPKTRPTPPPPPQKQSVCGKCIRGQRARVEDEAKGRPGKKESL